MPLTTAATNNAVDGALTDVTHVSLHSADPGASGTSEVSGGGYARLAATFNAASGTIAAIGGVPLSFTTSASQAVTHFGLWTALSGGTFRGGGALSGDQAANSSGEYDVTAITLDGNPT